MSEDASNALQVVLSRIALACSRVGRDPGSVRLVAVSKTFGADRVRELVEAGQRLFGENRVQEALAKISEVGAGATWHLIGPLQRNKARHVVGRFELLHGIDDEKLAHEIERRAAALGLRQPILIQLNLSGEPTKSGVAEERLAPLVEALVGMPHLELRGFMTIPPPVERPEQSREGFAELRRLRDRTAERFGLTLPELSMGMTDDFEVAVEEGATLVRVGRAIFGTRSSIGEIG